MISHLDGILCKLLAPGVNVDFPGVVWYSEDLFLPSHLFGRLLCVLGSILRRMLGTCWGAPDCGVIMVSYKAVVLGATPASCAAQSPYGNDAITRKSFMSSPMTSQVPRLSDHICSFVSSLHEWCCFRTHVNHTNRRNSDSDYGLKMP